MISMDNKIEVPHQVATLMYRLVEREYRCYMVGSAVRNLLIKEPMGDIDLITDAEINRLEAIFDGYRILEQNAEKGEMVVMAGGIPVMISRFRSGKNPDGTPIFGGRLPDELRQRDFTVNTICADMNGKIVDPFGGVPCLEQKPYILKAVGEGTPFAANQDSDTTEVSLSDLKAAIEETPPPADKEDGTEDVDSSITRDPLNIMKALALMGSGDYVISQRTSDIIKENVASILTIPPAQLRAAFEEILAAKRVSDVFLEFSEVIVTLFPELEPTIDYDQHSIFQSYTLYEHLCKSVGYSYPDVALRYALLFHGSGKPDCQATDEDGVATYYGHAERSMIFARRALERLEAPKELFDEVSFLITHHDMGELLDEQEAAALLDRFSAVDIRSMLLFACANLRANSPDNEQKAAALKKLSETITTYTRRS